MKSNTIHISEDFSELGTKNLDKRKRIAIGDALKREISPAHRFQVFESNSGDVLLRPVVEIPVREVWLYKNKKALESVKKGLKQSAEGKIKKLDLNTLAHEE